MKLENFISSYLTWGLGRERLTWEFLNLILGFWEESPFFGMGNESVLLTHLTLYQTIKF